MREEAATGAIVTAPRALEIQFRDEWLERLVKILPVPTLVMGAVYCAQTGTWLSILAVLAFLVFNVVFSKMIFRWPALDRGAHLRAWGNFGCFFLLAFAGGAWGRSG